MILISFVFQKLWDCEQTKFRPDQSSFASPIEVWFQTSCSHPSRFHPAVVSYLLSWFFSWEAPPPRLYSWIPIFYHDFLWGVISSRLSPHGFMLCGFPSPPHDILLMRDDRHLHGFFFYFLNGNNEDFIRYSEQSLRFVVTELSKALFTPDEKRNLEHWYRF